MRHGFTAMLHIAARSIAIAALLILIAAAALRAQTNDVASAGNEYVTAYVVVNNNSTAGGGRFYIGAGAYYNHYRFLYSITSNVVFRVTSGGQSQYFTNATKELSTPPLIDGTSMPVPNRPFDSVYVGADTIAVVWKGLAGFDVTMRLIPERPATSYDRGSDVLIEFSYQHVAGAPPAELGIFMMLDLDNGQTANIAGQSVLTSKGYIPSDGRGRIFGLPSDTVPAFYHVGDFRVSTPLNSVLPIHRLTGVSHNGAPLTTPDLFAVGNWRRLRSKSWEITEADVDTLIRVDPASVLRWGNLTGSGTVRTAFGMNNGDGNDMFHCRDVNLFIDMRTERYIVQTGNPSTQVPIRFDLAMWVTNTDTAPRNVTMAMLPIGLPAAGGRIVLDSTPSAQSVALAPRETRMLRWKLRTDPAFVDSSIDVPLDIRYHYNSAPNEVFRVPCTPVITLRRSDPVPPGDSTAPKVDLTASPRGADRTWSFNLYDRHDGRFDTGVDRVLIDTNEGDNAEIALSNVPHCDTRATMVLSATWRDTLKPVRLFFRLRDCAGNETRDSIVMAARQKPADNRPPLFIRYDSTRGIYHFRVSDRHAGFAFDTGIDSIVAERLDNFSLEGNTFPRCDTSVQPDFTAVVRFTKLPGLIALAVYDCRGNAARDTIVYNPAAGVAAGTGGSGELMIVEVRPQPLVGSAGHALDVKARGVRPGPLRADLVAADGRIVKRFEIGGGAAGIAAWSLPMPAGLPAGMYILRLVGSGASASAKVVVVE